MKFNFPWVVILVLMALLCFSAFAADSAPNVEVPSVAGLSSALTLHPAETPATLTATVAVTVIQLRDHVAFARAHAIRPVNVLLSERRTPNSAERTRANTLLTKNTDQRPWRSRTCEQSPIAATQRTRAVT